MAALSIDSSDSHKTVVSLTANGKRYEVVSEMNASKSQMILPLIEKLLEQAELKITDITDITVHTGPGSYTGLRVGIAIASMLGALLGVPVNKLPIGATVEPIYPSTGFFS